MTIDQRAADLGSVMQDIVKRFRTVNAAAAQGPYMGLNQQELGVLDLLGQEGPQMMRVLAQHLSLAVNSMTTIADGMEQKALVRRVRSTEDRRVVRVELTPSGTEVYAALTTTKLKWFRTMLEPLTTEEQEILLMLFRKSARVVRKQAPRVARSA